MNEEHEDNTYCKCYCLCLSSICQHWFCKDLGSLTNIRRYSNYLINIEIPIIMIWLSMNILTFTRIEPTGARSSSEYSDLAQRQSNSIVIAVMATRMAHPISYQGNKTRINTIHQSILPNIDIVYNKEMETTARVLFWNLFHRWCLNKVQWQW